MKCEKCNMEIETINFSGFHVSSGCKCRQDEKKRQQAQDEKDIMKGQEDLFKALLRIAQIPPRYQRIFLQNASPKKGQQEAFQACQEFLKNYPTDETGIGLYFLGAAGSGKSFLACAIANQILYNQAKNTPNGFKQKMADQADVFDHLIHPEVRFESTVRLMEKLKDCFNYKKSSEELLNVYKNARLLILDDIGVELSTDWAHSRLYDLIDYRDSHYKPSILTSNLTPKDLKEKLGVRICDRIREMCKLVPVTAESQRPTAE